MRSRVSNPNDCRSQPPGHQTDRARHATRAPHPGVSEVKMKICGIELSASEARLVLIKGKKKDFTLIDIEPRKIKLNDENDQNEVKAFRDSIFAFFREKNVSTIVIKKRGKKGEYAGGPVGFKLEGIIQLSNRMAGTNPCIYNGRGLARTP